MVNGNTPKGERPRIKLELTPADTFLEILGWATLAFHWWYTISHYSSLPDIIPIHFNGAGHPDGYGHKITIFLLPAIGTVLFVGLTILNRYPHIFNYPVNITDENAEDQYTNSTRMMRYMKFAVVLLFTAIDVLTYRTVTGEASGLGAWFLPFVFALIFIPLIFFVIRSRRLK